MRLLYESIFNIFGTNTKIFAKLPKSCCSNQKGIPEISFDRTEWDRPSHGTIPQTQTFLSPFSPGCGGGLVFFILSLADRKLLFFKLRDWDKERKRKEKAREVFDRISKASPALFQEEPFFLFFSRVLSCAAAECDRERLYSSTVIRRRMIMDNFTRIRRKQRKSREKYIPSSILNWIPPLTSSFLSFLSHCTGSWEWKQKLYPSKPNTWNASFDPFSRSKRKLSSNSKFPGCKI